METVNGCWERERERENSHGLNVQDRSGNEQWHWCLWLLDSMTKDNDPDNGLDYPTILVLLCQSREGWGRWEDLQRPPLCRDLLTKCSCIVATNAFGAWRQSNWKCIRWWTKNCMSLVSPVANDLQLQIALADSLLSCIPAKVKFQEFSSPVPLFLWWDLKIQKTQATKNSWKSCGGNNLK